MYFQQGVLTTNVKTQEGPHCRLNMVSSEWTFLCEFLEERDIVFFLLLVLVITILVHFANKVFPESQIQTSL